MSPGFFKSEGTLTLGTFTLGSSQLAVQRSEGDLGDGGLGVVLWFIVYGLWFMG